MRFHPFRGVAPSRYVEFFDMRARARAGQRRKDDDGTMRSGFKKTTAQPLLQDLEPEPFRPALPAYRRRELLALRDFAELSEQLTMAEDVPTDLNGNKNE